MWTKEKPGMPGAYWIKGWSLNDPSLRALVEVSIHLSYGLVCNIHQRNSDVTDYDKEEGWSPLSEMNNNFEWYGPLVHVDSPEED